MENNSIEKSEVNSKEFDYNVAINESYEVNEVNHVSILKTNIKTKRKLPFIVYILIFSSILFLGSLISLIVIYSKYVLDYDVYDGEIYIKPNISDHNYSKISFHNGLEIVLSQVNYNDSAGGAISFEKGYLNQEYDPGYLKLVFYSFRHNEKSSSRYLTYYMGDSQKSIEEFYSTIYFKILNSGFQNYLTNFTNQINQEIEKIEEIRNLIAYVLNDKEIKENINSPLNDLNEKEKHLIEYLIYGISENGSDIWRQCIDFKKFNFSQLNETEIEKILNESFFPQKIKMIFYSHYKMSLLRKIVIKNVKPISSLKEVNVTEEKIDFPKFTTNKIIYHQIDKKENHYIKINYYVNGSNENLSELYIDSGYFNYIKYILAETHNESLYYKLTHPENENTKLNIKSLSCNFEVVLKSKIRFTILIELNIYSYDYLKEIIEMVYNYMEKIKSHIKNLDSNDERVKELLIINEQNFTFMEDIHEMEYFKNKAKDLFYKDYKDYYLKEVWIPPDINENYSKIFNYSKQLTIENSVIFVSISEDIVKEYNLNKSSCAFIFSDLNYTTNFSKIAYSIHNIEELNISIENISDNYKLNYYQNKFISKYNKTTSISKDQKETNGIYTCLNLTDNLAKFYWKKHTKFGIPKIFINLYFLHPYLRPNTTDKNEQDYIYFHEMLYISYLKRELNFALGDVIRAGGTLEMGFNENIFYLDVSYYSDKIIDIVKIIYEKMISKKEDIFGKNLNLYKDYALNDLLNFDKINIKQILRYEFCKILTKSSIVNFPPIYNYYKFNKTNFINFTDTDGNGDNLNHINAQIVHGYILGYCEKEEAEKIYNIFKDGFDIKSFGFSLGEANYIDDTITPEEFVKSCLDRKQLGNNVTNGNITKLNNNSYLFMSFASYTYENRILVELLKKIGPFDNNELYRIESFHQKDISLRFYTTKEYYNKTEEFKALIIRNIEKNKANFTDEKFDVVGDNFYYMVTNMEIEYSKTPNSMKKCSFYYSYNELYELNENANKISYKIDRYNYDNFTETIKYIFKNHINSYWFSNNQSRGNDLSNPG